MSTCRHPSQVSLYLPWPCQSSDGNASLMIRDTLSSLFSDQNEENKRGRSVRLHTVFACLSACVRLCALQCIPSSQAGEEDQPTSSAKMSHLSLLIKKILGGKHWFATFIKTKGLMLCMFCAKVISVSVCVEVAALVRKGHSFEVRRGRGELSVCL